MLDLKNIDKSWTLFLDRDGVINHEKPEDYIYNYSEFIFYDGVKEALQRLAKCLERIIVITNQRGIGRGLMTEEDLHAIHKRMLEDINAAGGRIDAIYYCTAVDNTHPNRKPNPGMALQAKKDFSDIDFSKSIMVGNNLSDMQFGRNVRMFTVHIKTTDPGQILPHPLIDLSCEDLSAFAKLICN